MRGSVTRNKKSKGSYLNRYLYYNSRMKKIRDKYKSWRNNPEFIIKNRQIRDEFLHDWEAIKKRYGKAWKFSPERIKETDELRRIRDERIAIVKMSFRAWRKSKKCQAEVMELKKKRDYCKQQMRRMDQRTFRIRNLAKAVARFFEVHLNSFTAKQVRGTTGDKITLARKIYFKYGMERGITGSFLAAYIGYHPRIASRGRIKLTRSFKTNKNNHDTWRRFVEFMKTQDWK